MKAGHYRWRFQHGTFPGVAVLCYHGIRVTGQHTPFEKLHVTIDEFESHCSLARSFCNPISLAEFHAARLGKIKLPDRSLLMTFDDGYRSVLTRALPVLKAHAIPAAMFVCTEPVRTQTPFWFDSTAQTRGEAAVEPMKTLPFEQWRRAVASDAADAKLDDSTAPLTVEDIRTLADSGLVEFGAHTESHPILKLASLDQQRTEILSSKRAIQEWTGRDVTAFAYPNGRPGLDYGPETVALVRETGFALGFSTRNSFASAEEPDLELSRFVILAGVSQAELAHRLTYSWRL
jgi:peptidoglycan/xylan/chitin deacetylase (PgdA/CDA1 family)